MRRLREEIDFAAFAVTSLSRARRQRGSSTATAAAPSSQCANPDAVLLRKAEYLQQPGNGDLVVDLDGFVVDGDDHWMSSSSASSGTISSPTMASAVHGASRKPDLPVACGHQRAVVEPAHQRNIVGRHQPRSAAHSANSYSPSAGTTWPSRRPRSWRTPATAGAVSRPCSVLGGADDETPSCLRTGLHLQAVDAGTNHAPRYGHTAAPPPQPKRLALDGTDRQPRPQRGRVDSIGDDPDVRVHRRQIARRRPPHSEPFTVRGLDQSPIVDGEFGFGAESMSNPLGEKRSHIAGSRHECHGVPLCGQPLSDCLQVGRVGAVEGNHQGPARGDDVGRQAVEEGTRPVLQRRRRQAEAEQPLPRRPALAVRGQHACGNPPRTGIAGAVHAHTPPSSAARRATERPMMPPTTASDPLGISLLSRHSTI